MTKRLRRKLFSNVLREITREEDVVARYPKAVLLLEPIDENTRFETSAEFDRGVTHEVQDELVGQSLGVVHPEARVDSLSKSGRNAASEITAGRSSTNDVVLPEASVSKLHASFHETDTGWTVTDRNSNSGTFVDGVRVPAGEARALSDGVRLRFGTTITARFFTPKSFWLFCSTEKHRDANG